MSDIDILKMAIENLERISVPVQYTEQIAIPMYNSTEMLKKLYGAIIETIKKNAEANKEEPKEAEENENVEQSV